MKILTSIGTRPELIKMAPLIKEIERRGHQLVFVWTGQHYDYELYEGLIEDLEIKKPEYELNAKGHLTEIGAKILVELKKVLDNEKPDIVLVHGDTLSAKFSALSSALSLYPVGHVEAGLRTGSWEPFPEQIDTRTVDAASSLYFAPIEKNVKNLLNEGHPPERIHLVGNTIVDAVKTYSKKNPKLRDQLGIPRDRPFIYFTVHRKENTMSPERMKGIFDAILEMKDYTILVSVLPGTYNAAKKYGYLEKLQKAEHIIWKYPSFEKYSDVLSLLKEADLLLTDSGGLQEEGVSLNVPVLTLRYVTDRPETIEVGANKCIGFKKEDIIRESKRVIEDPEVRERMVNAPNPYGDGTSSKKIVDILEQFEGRFHRWESEVKHKS